jgi:prostaglandin reductase 2
MAVRVVLARRPGSDSATTTDCFATEVVSPHNANGRAIAWWRSAEPATDADADKEAALVVRPVLLSVDPYMRCRLNDESGVDYAPAFPVGSVPVGGGVAEIVRVNSLRDDVELRSVIGDVDVSSLVPGALLAPRVDALDPFPWTNADLAVRPADLPEFFRQLEVVPDRSATIENFRGGLLGAIGMPGITALVGLRSHAGLGKGECGKTAQTLVVSGAAGAVGTVAIQIARLLDSAVRVVGICGSDEKCELVTSLGANGGAINYRIHTGVDAMRAKLRELCPTGIDLYFDNVGGDTSEAVILEMNRGGKVILCGQIADYDTSKEYPAPLSEAASGAINNRAIDRRRFLVLNYARDLEQARQDLVNWAAAGQLKCVQTVRSGVENIAEAFVSLMSGGNAGKMLVAV